MEETEQTTSTKSWFWKWFLNNKLVSTLLVILLLLINIFVFTKISYIFSPLKGFFSIIGFPMVGAGILFYMVKPIQDFLVKKGVHKSIAILLNFILLIILLLAAIFSFIPIVEKQLRELVTQLPTYYRIISEQVERVVQSNTFSAVQEQLNGINMDFIQSLGTRVNGLLNVTFSGIGNVVGAVGEFMIGIITMPILLFYLLQDGEKILPAVLQVFPTRSRRRMSIVLIEMNQQISSYIRGQLTVAIAVAIMFSIGYAIIGLPYGVTIAILAGALNVIPYVGSFFGILPALIVGFVISPWMFVQVFIVFVIEQTLEGRIISPLILGNSLQIHPVTILVVLLSTGKIFGLVGLLLGVPGYAVLKVIISHIFDWYKEYSGLYVEEPKIEENLVKE